MNVEIGTEGVQFLFWEYINGIFVAVRSPGSCCNSILFSTNTYVFVERDN
jgi:hypothetical protein